VTQAGTIGSWKCLSCHFYKSSCTVEKPCISRRGADPSKCVILGNSLLPCVFICSSWVSHWALALLPAVSSKPAPDPCLPIGCGAACSGPRSCLSSCLQCRETQQHRSFPALGKPFSCHGATHDVSFQQQGASPCGWGCSACLYGK